MSDTLPYCMMPEWADPCDGYLRLQSELATVTAERDELRQRLNSFVKWDGLPPACTDTVWIEPGRWIEEKT